MRKILLLSVALLIVILISVFSINSGTRSVNSEYPTDINNPNTYCNSDADCVITKITTCTPSGTGQLCFNKDYKEDTEAILKRCEVNKGKYAVPAITRELIGCKCKNNRCYNVFKN